jgi:hypothetical protein
VAGCITLVHGDHAIGWRSYSIKELAAPAARTGGRWWSRSR